MAIGAAALSAQSGISVKSFRETREALASEFKRTFGEALNTASSGPDGMLIDIFAYAAAEAAQTVQAALANLDAATADGVFLDRIAVIAGLPRRDGETDAELRKRIGEAAYSGLATYDGMLTYLGKLVGNVSLSANDEPYAKDGVPGHSVAVLVPDTFSHSDADGNDDTDAFLAQAIWRCKPAGIRTHGTVSATATDAAGNPHEVRFERISGKPLSLSVVITEYDEERLPDDYADLIRAALAEWAKGEYSPGKDIIVQRFVGPVFDAAEGVESVRIAATFGGTTRTDGRIPVPAWNYATLAAADIGVSKE